MKIPVSVAKGLERVHAGVRAGAQSKVSWARQFGDLL